VLIVGFIYRLNAGSGFPLKEGRISGAYRVENIERVKKSSDGKEGAVKFENALAAERSRESDNERLDFRVDLGAGVGDITRLAVFRGTKAIGAVDLTGRGISNSGCADTDITDGEDTFRSYLPGLRSEEVPDVGVRGYENDEESEGSSGSSDGVERIESEDIERDGTVASSSFSSGPGDSGSDSSSSRKSSGEPFDIEDDEISVFHSSRSRSMDTFRGRDFDDNFRRGGGMEVLASKAATEAGSGLESFDFCLIESFFGDMVFFLDGIDTGDDEVSTTLSDLKATCVVCLTGDGCSLGRFLC
jgi:hypothetical protein